MMLADNVSSPHGICFQEEMESQSMLSLLENDYRFIYFWCDGLSLFSLCYQNGLELIPDQILRVCIEVFIVHIIHVSENNIRNASYFWMKFKVNGVTFFGVNKSLDLELVTLNVLCIYVPYEWISWIRSSAEKGSAAFICYGVWSPLTDYACGYPIPNSFTRLGQNKNICLLKLPRPTLIFTPRP